MSDELVRAREAVKSSEAVKRQMLDLIRQVEEAAREMEQILLSEPEAEDEE